MLPISHVQGLVVVVVEDTVVPPSQLAGPVTQFSQVSIGSSIPESKKQNNGELSSVTKK